eukprot:TRINITY_DN26703_c0_g1_i1.p1 TRINITY_DN26703_c0_g1~~TRINITY_DN26703_c0_g1_i1.p1  ORF type:complete len:369 (-),score=96.57 TRINITY_DN26703_c0_g1_i1:1-1107(-)
MKRPADSQLLAESRPPQPSPTFGSSSASASSNPFAGISLFGGASASGGGLFSAAASSVSSASGGGLFSSAASSAGGLFTSAANSAGVTPTFGGATPSFGTGSSGSASGGFSLGSSSTAPASFTQGSSAAASGSGNGNPFMGLSLFSQPSTAGGGGIFTAAASSLQQDQGKSADKQAETPEEKPAEKPGEKAADKEEKEGSGAAAEDDDEEAEEDNQEEEEGPAGDEPTGEEDEEVIYRNACKLFRLSNGKEDANEQSSSSDKGAGWRWQERGCGIVHINKHRKTGAGRLVMRMRGVLKLLLNTPIFPTTKYEKVGQKSVKFVGVDTDAKPDKAKDEVVLTAFRLNLQSSDQQEKFLAVLGDLVSKHRS